MINKIVLAIVLTIAALATVPASAGPYCQEDLGYGRTSGFGCGGFRLGKLLVPGHGSQSVTQKAGAK